jgi:hypothetical protein
MKPEEITKIKEILESITIADWKNPELVAEIIKLEVLLGDILSTMRAPSGTYNLIENGDKTRFRSRQQRSREAIK